jgi:SAM-dependent methyltransferase
MLEPMGKDLFSGHAADYAAARPTYPEALFDALACLAPARGLAWDCATGNGQAALPLAERFEAVWATDLSARQLAQAPAHPRITWHAAPAGESGLPSAAVDLVTVAQAYHWFDHESFHLEAERVLRPGGIVAVWCYGLLACTPAVDAVLWDLYSHHLGPWWEPERRLVETGYASVPWPFDPVPLPAFEMRHAWTLAHLLAYVDTWSALRTCRERTGSDPLADLTPALRRAWGDAHTRDLRWPLHLRAGRCG